MKLIFERSQPGRRGGEPPRYEGLPHVEVPEELRRAQPPRLPEVAEPEILRHFTELSTRNFGIDTGFYPLGSCTMKYNPRINERLVALPGFAHLHPLQDDDGAQGALELMWRLQEILKEVTGLHACSLQPAAGSQGELTGLMLMRAYFRDRGEDEQRRKIVIPDTAHGVGALMYYDGANLNAVCGISRPGDMGFDIVHINLHKTFSQPHGGGGPGGGPIVVRERLEPFLPVPMVVRDDDGFRLDYDRPQTIGRVRGFTGPFGVFVRSYAYIRTYGPRLREMSEVAVLNANYLLARLKDAYALPFDRLCMHEFVLSARRFKREQGVTALDVAKRLMDYGFHPPTIYFPLIVPEALMIEPTETEPKERLDAFADAMLTIAQEAADEPETLKNAPTTRPVRRLDEVKSAKNPVVRYLFEDHPHPPASARREPAAAGVEAPKGV